MSRPGALLARLRMFRMTELCVKESQNPTRPVSGSNSRSGAPAARRTRGAGGRSASFRIWHATSTHPATGSRLVTTSMPTANLPRTPGFADPRIRFHVPIRNRSVDSPNGRCHFSRSSASPATSRSGAELPHPGPAGAVAPHMPLYITDLDRTSVIEHDELGDAIRTGIARDGSGLGSCTSKQPRGLLGRRLALTLQRRSPAPRSPMLSSIASHTAEH